MANIFDGIDKMTDNQLKIEIAMFSRVRLSNAAIETGNRVLEGVVDMANSIMKSLGGKSSWEYEAVRVSDMVNSTYEELFDRDREWLMAELHRQIKQKLGVNPEKIQDNAQNVMQSGTDNMGLPEADKPEKSHTDTAKYLEKLSIMVINEAAAAYSLEKYDTPANKIEKISIEYNKAYLQAIHNILVKQTPEEAVKVNVRLQKRLDSVDIEVKRDLQRKIMPKEFSGAGIARVLRLERGIKNLTYVVEILGGECFGDIQSHVATILASVKALRRPSRVLMAQLVWQSKQCYGDKFTVDRTLLPSYIPGADGTPQEAEEKNLRQQLAVMSELEKKQEKCAEAVKKNEEQRKEAEERLEKLLGDFEKRQKEFEKLEADKERYVSGRMPEADTKRYYRNVNDINRQMSGAEESVKKQKAKIKELYEKGDRLSEELSVAEDKTKQNMDVVSEKVALLTGEIKNKWRAYYFRFNFEDDVFEKVAEHFWRSERLNIEELFKEIHDSKSFIADKNMEIYASSIENANSDEGQTLPEMEEPQPPENKEPAVIIKFNVAKGRNVEIKAEGNTIKAIELI